MLVVGGTGFIGRHLCVALARRRIKATVVSRNPDSAFLDTHAPGIASIPLSDLYEHGRRILSDHETVVISRQRPFPPLMKIIPRVN